MKRVRKKTPRQYNKQGQQLNELIFYTSRLYLIVNAILHFLMFLFLLVSCAIAVMKVFPRVHANDIFPLLSFFCMLLFFGWRMWNAISQIWVHKPLLLINNVGIFVYEFPKIDVFDRHPNITPVKKRQPDRPRASLLWKDIESISTARYLIILPKNVASQGRRYFRTKAFTVKTGEPLLIPRRYLDCPVEEILRQIRATYDRELEYYQIEM